MKSPSPANKSTPKARVMHAVSHRGIVRTVHRDLKPAHVFSWETVSHCLVRPCASRKQADQLARFANLTWEEKREKIGVQIQRWLNGYALPAKYPTVADAVLGVLGELPGKGEGDVK